MGIAVSLWQFGVQVSVVRWGFLCFTFSKAVKKYFFYSTVQSHVKDGTSCINFQYDGVVKKVPLVVRSTTALLMCYLSVFLHLSFLIAVCS